MSAVTSVNLAFLVYRSGIRELSADAGLVYASGPRYHVLARTGLQGPLYMGVANSSPLFAKKGFSKILEALRGNLASASGLFLGVIGYCAMRKGVATDSRELTA